MLDVPVESFDERFTTDLAQRGGGTPPRTRARPPISSRATSSGRAPADPEAPVEPPRRGRQRPSQGQILARRLIALGVLFVALIGLALAGYALRGGGTSSKPATTRVSAAAEAVPDHLPGGLHAPADGRAGRCGRPDRRAQAAREGRAVVARLPGGDGEAAAVPGFGEKARTWLEGFLFPATYDFAKRTTSAKLAALQLKAFERNWRGVNLSYARSKNLTPYDVLTIASMVEKEAVAPEERARSRR